MSIQELLEAGILRALARLAERGELPADLTLPIELTLERPKNRDHGDYATSIALALAKSAGKPPREIAQALQAALLSDPEISTNLSAVDIAGPGFLNLTLAKASQGGVIQQILSDGVRFGEGKSLTGTKVNLEFVSANPTGPLHLGHTRWAAVGDALGRVLSAAGADVTREFYVNDRGVQMDLFGASIRSAALGQPRPEDGYHGAYIEDLAQEIVSTNPEFTSLPEEESIHAFRDSGYALQLADQQDQGRQVRLPPDKPHHLGQKYFQHQTGFVSFFFKLPIRLPKTGQLLFFQRRIVAVGGTAGHNTQNKRGHGLGPFFIQQLIHDVDGAGQIVAPHALRKIFHGRPGR